MKRFRLLLATSGMLALTGAAALVATGAGASAASGLPTMTVALNGKTVVIGGQTVSGAVNVVSTVTKEPFGSTLLFRLNPGETPAVFGQAAAAVGAHHGDLNYLSPFGSIVFDAGTAKGTGSAQADLAPGTYVALDPGNGNSRGTPPHAVFTVTPSAAPAPLPAAQATENSIDFGFTGPKTLHDGELVRFVNLGFVVHMDVWQKVKSMSVAKKLVALLLAGNDKAAGKLAPAQGGFEGPVSTGGLVQLTIAEPPGIYVQECFMTTQDGREHTVIGMERIIKIVK